MSLLWTSLGILSLILECLVVGAIFRSAAYRRYPLLFAFSLILLFTAVVEGAAALAPAGMAFHVTPQFKYYYWINENIIQCLTFALMVSMIYRAMEGIPTRGLFCAGLSAVLLLMAAVALVLMQNPNASVTRWMTGFCRNLSFVSALLNFFLWSALVRQRRREASLLLISAGLGLMTTGKAIGHSLRTISASSVFLGNLVIVMSSLLCLFLWWWSFRRWGAAAARRRKAVKPFSAEATPNEFSGTV